MNQDVELTPAIKKAQIALTAIGLSGIVLSFVPFTGDVLGANYYSSGNGQLV